VEQQYYYFDVDLWLQEHKSHPLMESAGHGVRIRMFHMLNADVISMPDKWEYPWYAAWETKWPSTRSPWRWWTSISPRSSCLLMLRGLYSHPNGQIPAYEWNFTM